MKGAATTGLDDRVEAQAQREFARHVDGHPFNVIPEVMTNLSGDRVPVSDWVEGAGFEQVKQRYHATRDRFAEIVLRSFFGSRHGHVSGDPHPGSYLLLEDGQVAFIDFGMTKRIAPDRIMREKTATRDALDCDAAGVRAELAALSFVAADDPRVDPEDLLAYVRSLDDWHADRRPFRITSGYVTKLIASVALGSRNWKLEKHLSLPH
jgi:predicted unusual protein kinase regulating ubiquinone biosynthesis (AarF/ABC1/UbiB family)